MSDNEQKQAEEQFRVVVESAPNAIVMVNTEGNIVLVNRQTEKFFGYRREELVGQPVEILVPERFRSDHVGDRARFFVSPSARLMGTGRDLYGRRKDGSEFPVEIGLNPVETGEGLLVLSAIVDITERKRAEESLRQSKAELEKALADLQLSAYKYKYAKLLLTGAAFVQGLVFGWLDDTQASLEDLCEALAAAGVVLTPQALDQRFSP